MLIRTYADIEKLDGEDALSEAETLLIKNSRIGVRTVLEDGRLPAGPSRARTIRADILRYLILGGCEEFQVHEWGMLLTGAWVQGTLDLTFARAKSGLRLVRCSFESPILARQVHLESWEMSGSSFPSLSAAGANIAGNSIFDQVTTTGALSFAGAILGGQLSCRDAEIGVADSHSIFAQGASIKGGVFLDGIKCQASLIFAEAAIGGQLSCDGGQLDGPERGILLNAQGASIGGSVFLRRLASKGPVSFSGAMVSGQFLADGAHFDVSEGLALNAQNVQIGRDAFLMQTKFIGGVSFSGAKISGQMAFEGASLKSAKGLALNAEGAIVRGDVFLRGIQSDGPISFSGAEVGGQFSCDGSKMNGGDDKALNGQRMTVGEGFFWRGLIAVSAMVDLKSAKVGAIVDDQASWNLVDKISLIGAGYDDLTGSHDLSFRKAWLLKGATFEGQFHPHPYQQLAKVYRETGHRYEAREILVAKEIEQRKATRKAIREGKARTESWLIPDAQAFLNLVWDWTTRLVAGYGYKPWLSLGWLAGMIGIIWTVAYFTWNAGDFAPNSAVILTSPDWKTIADGPSENPAADWTDAHAPGKDYETFYAFAYALDVVVPVLDLGQTDAWAPSPARGDWGKWMFYLQKMFIVAGWVVTAIAAAAISGMIRRDD